MAIFYVFQGVTYELEKEGGYVWSPQLTKNGKKNSGYSNMMKIKKGNFILHNQSGKVVAISVARGNYKIIDRPSEFDQSETADLWNKEGYLVKLKYYPVDEDLNRADFRQWLIDKYKKNSAFAVIGRIKQRY